MIFNKVNNNGFDCFQICEINMLNFYSKPYEAISIGNWNFSYNTEEELIGNRIKYKKNIDVIFDVYKYQLDYLKKESVKKQDIVNYVSKENVMIVRSSLFFCSWHKAYKRYDIGHFFMILEYNEDDDVFICFDPYFEKDNIILSYSALYNMIEGFIVFRDSGEKISKKKLIEVMKYDIYQTLSDNIRGKIYQFGCDLIMSFNIEKEIYSFNSEIFRIPIIENLRVLENYREGYYLFYSKISSNTFVQDLMQICIRDWRKIRLLFMLMVMRKDEYNSGKIKDIGKKIIALGEKEETILKKLVESL